MKSGWTLIDIGAPTLSYGAGHKDRTGAAVSAYYVVTVSKETDGRAPHFIRKEQREHIGIDVPLFGVDSSITPEDEQRVTNHWRNDGGVTARWERFRAEAPSVDVIRRIVEPLLVKGGTPTCLYGLTLDLRSFPGVLGTPW